MTATPNPLPDFCSIRAGLRTIRARHPADGQPCPVPRCPGTLRADDAALACDTCGPAARP